MATIKLTNISTGVAYNYPLAYLDLSDTTNIDMQDGSVFGAHLTERCADVDPSWSSRPENEKQIYRIHIGTTGESAPSTYLSEYIDPTSPDNLIHEPASTTMASLFTPALTHEGVTWEEKPADYDMYGKYYNPTSYVYGGVNFPIGGGGWQTNQYPSDPGPSLERKWYTSTRANQLYKTAQNTSFAVAMGLSAYTPQTRQTLGVVAMGPKQWNSAGSPESNSYPQNNRGWDGGDLSTINGSVTFLNSGYVQLGAYEGYEAYHDTAELDQEVVPCSKISTQMVYSNIDGVGYVGCAVILFEPATLGLRPADLRVTMYPAWLFGGMDGEFLPPGEVEHVDNIPTPAAQVKNGSWTITQSTAGIPSVPTSPLSSIGRLDAGIHMVVMDSWALNKIVRKAWLCNSTEQLQAFMSAVINCGFVPYQFIRRFMNVDYGMINCVLGHTKVDLDDGIEGSYHMWHCNQGIFTRPILEAGQSHFHTFEIPLIGTYGNYLDYEPYTKVELDIPFCGKISIPASTCIGGKIHVDFQINLTNGDICAIISTVSAKGLITDGMAEGTPDVLYKTYYLSGNCMCPFPIIGTTTGVMQQMNTRMQMITGAAGMVGSIACGNVVGALGSAASVTQNLAKEFYHVDEQQPFTGGASIGSPVIIGNKKIVLTISIPAPQYSDRYIASNPFYSYQKEKLSKLHEDTNTQYNVNNLSKVVVSNIEFASNTGMTETEEIRIKELLKEGVLV